MRKIKRFTNRVKKTESVQMVNQIVKKHLLFKCFVKWVEVVSRAEFEQIYASNNLNPMETEMNSCEILVNKSLHLGDHCKKVNRYLISTTDIENLDNEVDALEIESFADKGQINSMKPRF